MPRRFGREKMGTATSIRDKLIEEGENSQEIRVEILGRPDKYVEGPYLVAAVGIIEDE